MKLLPNRTIFLFSFLFLYAIITSFGQQNIEQYNSNGLSTIIFKNSLGKITVYIPDHTVNEKISGIIKIEPQGNSEKKKSINITRLQKYQLSFGNTTIPLQSSTYTLIVPVEKISSLQLLDDKRKVISTSVIPSEPGSKILKPSTYVPEYMVAGEPAKIIATCDGNLANSNIAINTMNASVLAESESAVFFKIPANSEGSTQLEFTNEGQQVIETSVHVLRLDLSVGKADLMRGETTTLSINISGLQGLDKEVPLSIANNSPSNISLEGGNTQQIIINPVSDAPNGNYASTISIRAMQRGSFSISVKVEEPSPDDTITSSQELLCNCWLNGQTHLISPKACTELGGNCNHPKKDWMPDSIEDVRPPDFDFVVPANISNWTEFINLKVEDHNDNDIIAVSFSYRLFDDEQWQTIGRDNTFEDSLNVNWNPPLGNDGVNEIRTLVVNKNNVTSQNTEFIYLNVTPQELTDANINVSFSISENDIQRDLDRAGDTGDRIDKEEDKLDDLYRKYWDAFDNKRENEDARNELTTIDEILDGIPNAYKDSLIVLVDSLLNLKNQLPAVIDKKALQKAVDDAQKRADDCNKRLEDLKQEQQNLEAERDKLKQQLDDTLEAIDNLHTGNGWTGGYGYHSDGRPWYGYIGDERSNTDIDAEQYQLRKKLRSLRKPYLKALRRLEQLPNEIADAEKECDKLNDALEKAKEAAKKGDQYMATEVAIDDILGQIGSLLKPLLNWCDENPGHSDLKEKLEKLMEASPKTQAELDAFWDDLDEIINDKKALEESFGDAANADQDTIDSIENDIKNTEEKINDLKDQQQREYAEAERKRQQRAQELEDERKREREAEARRQEESRRTAAKPQPFLEEPVNPSDDQLKFQAQTFIFKSLYREYLIANGPCDCITKAMAFANNTNSIVSDLIGRIGVGVAFAPLEAFPGVSLAGRLGIGAVKALASSLFGGQSFSDELTKNLFNEIGGEIFPKLVGNDFAGSKLNDLAGKGLEEILESEGVRAIEWEGTTKLNNCGEISGKTTMLFNPNTGWVTILIKIDNCPLIVIKYKVNDDGVPITEPIVKKIRG
jgi:TolA-binding protein